MRILNIPTYFFNSLFIYRELLTIRSYEWLSVVVFHSLIHKQDMLSYEIQQRRAIDKQDMLRYETQLWRAIHKQDS
jgi:hypothetical protein